MESFRVLVVDDEEEFVNTLVKRLNLRGAAASGAGSGQEALNFLDERPADVVVLDVKMPDMDGIETLRAIKGRHPLVEVIMLTGHASLEVAIEGMEAGAFDYLMKPVNMDELLYKLQDAYKKKAIQAEKIQKMGEIG
ncbi:MAG: response regulator [Deltaproteobacteria bacterium]|nr:response regulator [Deltaproteobacteria bacterium]